MILGIEDDPETVTPEEITEVVEEGLLVMTNNTAVTDPVKQNVQVRLYLISYKIIPLYSDIKPGNKFN